MVQPTSRTEFGQYCLRKLGAPMIEANITEEQIDDRIDDALKYYQDYHADGTEKLYYQYQLTQTDIDNQYIALPPNIIGAVRIFEFGSFLGTGNIFSIKYQIAINDLYNLANLDVAPYYTTRQHLDLLQEVLIGKQPIRFNRNNNIIYIDMDWSNVIPTNFIVLECYSVIDPDIYVNVWTDRWLKEYCFELIKQQVGQTLSKYNGMTLPNGTTFNALAWKQEATARIADLEQEMIFSHSTPCNIFVG